MKKPLKLLVIGGVAAGTKAASKARRDDPGMEITILTEEEYISSIGCGLAYYIGGVVEKRESLFARSPDAFREKQQISILLRHRAESINTFDRTVKVADLNTGEISFMPYDRLLISTGASPIIPEMEGVTLKGIHPLHTISDADAIKSLVDSGRVKHACIMGGGFIGIEMAENLLRRGIEVTLFEAADHLMPRQYDPDLSALIREHMESKGVSILTGTGVENCSGDPNGLIRAVSAGGKEYPCGLVIVAVGVKPNTRLAREARIAVGPTGAIKVDPRMETSVRGIFAAGDCSETTHLVSKKPFWLSLGSTANKQGRVAGANIAGGRKQFTGVLGTAIVKVFDKTAGRTGLNEKEAAETDFNPVSVTVTTSTSANYYPGAKSITLKLVADRGAQKLLGAQAFGDDKVDKVIDIIATALTGKISIPELTNLDLAYSPPYSQALGTVLVAAEVLEKKLGM
ncbi:MAG: FAD-dependent oxidoreductase [Candidatus Latescibacter sp.]|nr:FAD-dependent oxidoreductase [Candidatus Latescibacter sp.]